MDGIVTLVLVFVYLGMILGNIPGLALNRSGIALFGAIFPIIIKGTSFDEVVKRYRFFNEGDPYCFDADNRLFFTIFVNGIVS